MSKKSEKLKKLIEISQEYKLYDSEIKLALVDTYAGIGVEMDNEKCSKEHITCAFYNTKNSMHCASCRHRVLFLSEQLLAEQAKNSELEATLKILKINHKLTVSELNNEQAKNKKLVEALGKINNDRYEYTCDYSDCNCWNIAQQALNEVNNAK